MLDSQAAAQTQSGIEPGSHLETVWAVSVYAAGRFAPTGSADHTARVWDLKTRRLMQMIYTASNARVEGSVYATAISPDGNTLAFGGRTGPMWSGDGTWGFYVYSRPTGNIIRTVAGLKGIIRDLAFSSVVICWLFQ